MCPLFVFIAEHWSKSVLLKMLAYLTLGTLGTDRADRCVQHLTLSSSSTTFHRAGPERLLAILPPALTRGFSSPR